MGLEVLGFGLVTRTLHLPEMGSVGACWLCTKKLLVACC